MTTDALARLREDAEAILANPDAWAVHSFANDTLALLDIAEAAKETFREFKLWSEDANDGEFAIWSEDRIMAAVFQKLGPALAALSDTQAGERITHGRHCTCTPCAAQDWTEPQLAPCGMHGPDCPAEYQPLGGAGTYVADTQAGER